jgi:cellulose synthase operon protein C
MAQSQDCQNSRHPLAAGIHGSGGLRGRRSAGGLVIGALVLALSSCGGPSESTTRASLSERLSAGDHAGALVQLKALVQSQPQAAYARALLGQTLLELGDPAGAQVELQRALELGHAAAEVAPLLARALLLQGQADVAVQRFGDTTLPPPAAGALALTLAQARQALGQPSAALVALQRALEAQPDDAGLQVMRARLLADLGRVGEATQAAQDLAARFPGVAEVWLLRGDALAAQGDEAGATGAYGQVLALDPRHATAHTALVQQALSQGQLEVAREHLGRMRKALPNLSQVLHLEAQVAYAAGDNVTARARLQALLSAPSAPPAMLRLAGLVERRLGALEAAQALLSRAADRLPAHQGVRLELAEVLSELGRADRALELLQPLAAAPDAPVTVWRALGQAQVQLGRFKAADEAFARARAMKPQDAALRADVARLLLAQGEPERAMRELQTAADSRDGASASAAHMRQGDTAAALKAAERLAQQRPNQALPELLRGHVHEARGERAAARTAYERALALDAGFLAAVESLAELDRRDGKPESARQRYERMLKAQPASAAALLALASQSRSEGAPAATVRGLLDRAVAAQPADPSVWLQALALEQALGDGAARLARAERAASALPDNLAVQLAHSDSLQAIGEVARSLDVLRRLAARQPRAAPVRLLLAEAQMRAGDLAAARRSTDEALAQAPRDFAVQRAHAVLLLREGRSETALAVSRQLLADAGAPDRQVEALMLQADAQRARGQPGEAVKPLRDALALRRDTFVAQRLASALRTAGDGAAADRFEAEWQREAPADLDFVAHLAQEAEGRGDTARAVALYRRIVARVPDAALALNNLASLLLEEQPAEALALAERATKLAPGSAPLLDTLAQALLARQQLERALKVQRAAVQIDPRSGDLRLTLARIHLAAGRKDDARSELQRLAERPDYPRRLLVEELLQQLGR